MTIIDFNLRMFTKAIKNLATQVRQLKDRRFDWVCGIPSGGCPVAIALAHELNLPMCGYFDDEGRLILPYGASPENVLLVDDIVDSGRTRRGFKSFVFAAIHIRGSMERADLSEYAPTLAVESIPDNHWIAYWWEKKMGIDGPTDAVTRLITWAGDSPDREGLAETPQRVVKAYKELFSGYRENVQGLFKTFEDGACNEMVLLKDVEFYSTCEHHMMPFTGVAHIAYIPDGLVIGVSKLARILDAFAHRLQIQERIGTQVTDALMQHLHPKGAACIIEARHLCMCARGVGKQRSSMVTSSLRGAFLEKEAARAELMMLIHS